ncbi:hypothetical protein [Arthrobacter sp. R4-81]
MELQRILQEDLHGRYARRLEPGPGRDTAIRAVALYSKLGYTESAL